MSDPVGIQDIAQRAGVAPVTVRQWRSRYPDFPQPKGTVSSHEWWEWREVSRWMQKTGRGTLPPA